MEVTPAGMVTLVSLVQLSNAPSPMEVTGLLMMVEGITTAPVAVVGYPVMVIEVPLSV
jgi:hypothetical protein